MLAALKRTGYDGWIAMEPFEYMPDGPTCAARSIGYVSGHPGSPRMNDAPRLKLVEVERYERDVRLRLPFRFGVITVTHATQAVIRATHRAAGRAHRAGRRGRDAGGEMVRQEPRAVDDAQNLDQLRQSLAIAIELYTARGFDTPFGLYAGVYREQQARGAALDLNPLVASYGPALLDRAIADALGRGDRPLLPGDGLAATSPASARPISTPDLAGFDIGAFLGGLRMAPSIEVRHTVGLVDPITAGDQKPGERVDDGLPETLEEVVRHYRGRYYKLKVGGNIAADLERLARIAAVLDRALPASIARRSTATSSTTTSRASPSCGGACARRRR